MIISAVDERKDLFSVSDIVPTQLIDQISQDAVLQIPYAKWLGKIVLPEENCKCSQDQF